MCWALRNSYRIWVVRQLQEFVFVAEALGLGEGEFLFGGGGVEEVAGGVQFGHAGLLFIL